MNHLIVYWINAIYKVGTERQSSTGGTERQSSTGGTGRQSSTGGTERQLSTGSDTESKDESQNGERSTDIASDANGTFLVVKKKHVVPLHLRGDKYVRLKT